MYFDEKFYLISCFYFSYLIFSCSYMIVLSSLFVDWEKSLEGLFHVSSSWRLWNSLVLFHSISLFLVPLPFFLLLLILLLLRPVYPRSRNLENEITNYVRPRSLRSREIHRTRGFQQQEGPHTGVEVSGWAAGFLQHEYGYSGHIGINFTKLQNQIDNRSRSLIRVHCFCNLIIWESEMIL